MSGRKRDGALPGNYDVGYGKPPKHTRFRSGVSGNPAGRKPGSLGIPAKLQKILNQKVRVTDGGVDRYLSLEDVMYRSIVNKGAKGDLKAAQLVLGILGAVADEPATPINPQLASEDQAILSDYLRREGSPAEAGVENVDGRTSAQQQDDALENEGAKK